MRILFIILFSIFVQANDLFDLTNEIIQTNIKINELNHLISDDSEENSQNKFKINSEIKELKNSKIQTLAIYPTTISTNNLNEKILKDYEKSIKNKELKLAYRNFYECILSIISYNNNSENKEEDLKNILDNYLKELSDIKSKDDEKIQIDSLIEILTYIRVNIDVFISNDIFKQIDTSRFLKNINAYFPKSVNDIINPAKIILSLSIMLIIFMLKKILLKIVFFIIVKVFKINKNDHFINLLDNLTKPLIALFYIYGFWLCFLVAFYPAPIMPIVLTIFGVLYTILFTWLVLTILNGYGMMVISKIAQKSGKKDVVNLMLKISYCIIIFIAILIILTKLGFDISAIIASLGIGGLAVALAAKDIIANFFASVLVLFDNSFSQGDWVVVDGTEGTIVETGLRKTAIRTFDNSLVFVPNSKIMNANIKNWSKRKLGRKIGLTIGIEYGASTEQIQNILNDLRTMLKNHPEIAQPQIDSSVNQKDFHSTYRQNMVSVDDLDGYKNTLFVYLDEFASSSINIVIYCFSKTVVWGEFLKVKEDIMLKAMQIVEKNGNSFAFPSTSIYVEKFPKFKNL